MKRNTRQLAAPLLAGLWFALVILCPGGSALAQGPGYDLCVEHSPATAGRVSPDAGTHHYLPNSVVSLSADPQPGYQFAYWIGDVSNPKTPSTTVRLDSSKIVVAVFKPISLEETDPKIAIRGSGGGGGALIPTKMDLSSPSFSVSGGGGGTRKVIVPVPVVVTPEPATLLLVGFGAFALRRRRRCSSDRNGNQPVTSEWPSSASGTASVSTSR